MARPTGAEVSFLSTSPARGTTGEVLYNAWREAISIHVPREGDDGVGIDSARTVLDISIHVPREGDDSCCRMESNGQKISIHVPREGDDLQAIGSAPGLAYFYPRPPRGGRR